MGKMRVGILTFHWATNYGAVLQALALQSYLRDQGHDCQIVDYRPARVIRSQLFGWALRGRLDLWRRERVLRSFREGHLVLTPRTFRRSRDLRRSVPDFDVFVCGSDQVWNEWFVMNAERTPTLSYYLDFVGCGARRVAYGASFGTEHLSPRVSTLVHEQLSKFSAIGVREATGRVIVERFGLEATVVADPTLLPDRAEYDRLMPPEPDRRTDDIFPYLLHDGQVQAHTVLQCVRELLGREVASSSRTDHALTVGEWLARIRDARLVVTNSYHCVLFSIIFHTPFIALRVETGGMNDRLATLLGALGIPNRIAQEADSETLSHLLNESIDWPSVDAAVERARVDSVAFLRSALSKEPSEAWSVS